MKEKDDYALSMAIIDKSLYLLYTKSGIMMFALPDNL
jgi:hypothetical protein